MAPKLLALELVTGIVEVMTVVVTVLLASLETLTLEELDVEETVVMVLLLLEEDLDIDGKTWTPPTGGVTAGGLDLGGLGTGSVSVGIVLTGSVSVGIVLAYVTLLSMTFLLLGGELILCERTLSWFLIRIKNSDLKD